MSIYTRHRQFRIPGSSKAKNYSALKLPSREFLEKARIIDRQGPADFTASDFGWTVLRKKKNLPNKRVRNSNKILSKNVYGLTNSIVVDQIERMLRLKGDTTTKVFVDREGRFVGRNGPSGRECIVGGEFNLSDNCFFRISNGVVFYTCFDSCSHAYCASIAIGVLSGGKGAVENFPCKNISGVLSEGKGDDTNFLCKKSVVAERAYAISTSKKIDCNLIGSDVSAVSGHKTFHGSDVSMPVKKSIEVLGGNDPQQDASSEVNQSSNFWNSDVFIVDDKRSDWVQPYAPRKGSRIYAVQAGMAYTFDNFSHLYDKLSYPYDKLSYPYDKSSYSYDKLSYPYDKLS